MTERERKRDVGGDAIHVDLVVEETRIFGMCFAGWIRSLLLFMCGRTLPLKQTEISKIEIKIPAPM